MKLIGLLPKKQTLKVSKNVPNSTSSSLMKNELPFINTQKVWNGVGFVTSDHEVEKAYKIPKKQSVVDSQSVRNSSLIENKEPFIDATDDQQNVLKELGKYMDISMERVMGGTSVSECIHNLSKDPQIIVGSPGRILDMIRRRYLPTVDIKLLTFDEADEILSHGFKEDIHDIIKTVDKSTQICIFSATLPEEILDLTDKFMNKPERVLVKKEALTLEGIQQFFINIKHNDWKYDVITDLYVIILINHFLKDGL